MRIASFLLLVCFFLTACNSSSNWNWLNFSWTKDEPFLMGSNVSKEETLSPFSIVKINGPYDVDVRFIPHQSYIHITGNQTLVDLTQFYVSEGVLHVHPDPTYQYNSFTRILLTIEVPMLHRLEYQGAGRVALMGIDGEHFDLNANGSGYFFMTGSLSRFDASIGGNSRLNAKCLRARTLFINTGDMAQAEVTTLGYLSAVAGDNSDIYYYQHPTLVAPFMVSSGSVMRMEGILDPYLSCPEVSAPLRPANQGAMSPVVSGLG